VIVDEGVERSNGMKADKEAALNQNIKSLLQRGRNRGDSGDKKKFSPKENKKGKRKTRERAVSRSMVGEGWWDPRSLQARECRKT